MSNKPIANVAPAIYAAIYQDLVEIARQHGYCLAIHGSMLHDFDLIACAWVESASTPDELINAIFNKISFLTKYAQDINRFEYLKGSIHPCGRLAYAVPIDNDHYLDISVYSNKSNKTNEQQ